jgi:predicted dehydrogenase
LWDIGSYPVSFVRSILGEPEKVFGWQTLAESGVDESFVGLLRFSGGAIGIVDSSFVRPFHIKAEVVGTEGTLLLERPYMMAPVSRIIIRREDEEEVDSASEVNPYQCEVEAMAAAVLDGTALPLPLSSSRANVATLLALYESAREGAPRSVG